MHTGAVVTGDPRSGEPLVTGETVTIAARLEQAAAQGQILLSETTWRLVRDAVTVEPIAPRALHGQSPVDCRLSARGRHGPGRRARAAPGASRWSGGGEMELSLLRTLFERTVRERSPQLVTLLGTAGVGKSRLVAAFLAALGDMAAVFQGRCLPYGEGITYWRDTRDRLRGSWDRGD